MSGISTTALNNTTRGSVELAFLMPFDVSQNDTVPEWIQVLPSGPTIRGRDGRTFTLPNVQGVLNAFLNDRKDMPIDYEHATELKGPKGEPAPAAGWIKALQARDDGSVWGRVEWTPRGSEVIKSKEYRYARPAFRHVGGAIQHLLSVGLTNQPNLYMTALNARTSETQRMDKLRKLLGLSPDATDEQVEAAVVALQRAKADAETALNTAQNTPPSLDKWVPRADYQTALQRAETAEKKAKDDAEAARKVEIEAAITEATKAGKITPASADYHRAMCAQEGGLERFREFARAQPVIAPDNVVNGGAPSGGGLDLNSLTPDEIALCRNMALDPKDYLKAKQDNAATAN